MKDPIVLPIGDFSETASSLLIAAVSNDEKAWAILVTRYSSRVYLIARKAGVKESDAADVLQEVFAKVSKSISKFHRNEQRGSFRRWLRVLTQNAITDRFRREARTLPLESTGGTDHLRHVEQIPEPATESHHTNIEKLTPEQQSVLEVSGKSDPTHWEIFQACVANELTPTEIAKLYGIETGQVYVIKSRITSRIRQAYQRLIGQELQE